LKYRALVIFTKAFGTSGANSAFDLMGTETFSLGIKHPGLGAHSSPLSNPELRMRGAIPTFPYMSNCTLRYEHICALKVHGESRYDLVDICTVKRK
jgi:hypothetical protein